MSSSSSQSPRSSRGSRQRASRTGARSAGERRRSPSRRPKLQSKFPAWLVSTIAGALLSGGVCAGLLWWWGATPASDPPEDFRRIEVGAAQPTGDVIRLLEAEGLVEQPRLFRIYQWIWRPLFDAVPGVHWVSSGHSPSELLGLLERSRTRRVVRVPLPEGWDSFQMAERLAGAGVCERDEFLRAVLVGPTEDASNSDAESPWASFEGRLYPAAYDFRLDTSASDVVARLVAEADKRHSATFQSYQSELTRLQRELSLATKDIVALASVVEKEAANEAELPLVASVFLNRLRDPDFRPARMLQSDPTAAYGCKREPGLNSCRQFTGKVTAGMLRDTANAWNTYRHPGLPPTPIANPSTRAIAAVLTAPATDYLFFVSPDGGPHRFSRTLEEHERHLR